MQINKLNIKEIVDYLNNIKDKETIFDKIT